MSAAGCFGVLMAFFGGRNSLFMKMDLFYFMSSKMTDSSSILFSVMVLIEYLELRLSKGLPL